MKIMFTPKFANERAQKGIGQESVSSFKSVYKSNLPVEDSFVATRSQNISFQGGASINLAKTIEGLDKLAIHNDKIYPPNIREWAQMILDSGNKSNETLIDVHKKFYEGIDEIFSLDSLKRKFSEFSNVLSDNEVNYSQRSFIGRVKTGKSEYFDSEEDLSLQLIKLYWGKGFSLNDIKQYAGNEDVYYTMKKLNIPLVGKNYGYMLKFSDPEYNQRLTREMTAKRLETIERNALQKSGEPVYIPRGPLSDEHKKKISEGLLKHYEEHPEKIFEMSKKQKEFYDNNPDRAQFFSRVMNKVWGIHSNQRIKDAIVEFFISKGERGFTHAQVDTPTKFSTLHSSILKEFWGKNNWAREAFAKTLKYAWKKTKEEQMSFYEFSMLPRAFVNKLNNLDRHVDPNTFRVKLYPYEPQLNSVNKSNYDEAVLQAYLHTEPVEGGRLKDTFIITLLTCFKKVSSLDKSKMTTSRKEALSQMEKVIRPLFENPNASALNFTMRDCTSEEIQACYHKVMEIASKDHNELIISLLNKTMDSTYEVLNKLESNQEIVLDIRSHDLKVITQPKNN